MNWKRIWSGTYIAALFMYCFDMLSMRLIAPGMVLHWEIPTLVQILLDGFFCTCLYAAVRPRLGPGPKTAVIVGSTIYLIKHGLSLVWILLRPPVNGMAAAL